MKRILVVLAVVMVLTLALGAASAGAQPMWGPWYHVRYGDTLSGIAAMYGTSYWEIARANGIWNPNLIYAGQMLFIPPYMPGPYPGGFGGGQPGMYPGGFGGGQPGMYPGGFGGGQPGMYPGGFGGYGGMYPGGFGGGYASWSSGGYTSWGGYPQYPYWGGYPQYPYLMQMPYGGGSNGGGWGNAMPMGASF